MISALCYFTKNGLTECYSNLLAFMFHNSNHQIPHQLLGNLKFLSVRVLNLSKYINHVLLVNITLLSTATMCKSYNLPAATTVSNTDATYNQLVNFDLHGESKLIVYCILGILLLFLARKCQKLINHCHKRKLKKTIQKNFSPYALHPQSQLPTNFQMRSPITEVA